MKAVFKVDSIGGEQLPNVTLKPASGDVEQFVFHAAANGSVLLFLKGDEERKLFSDGGEFVVEITKTIKEEETHGHGI